MAFDNEYPNRKDHRKPYKGSKRFDRSCRNHGSCPYCQAARTFKLRKAKKLLDMDFQFWYKELTESE